MIHHILIFYFVFISFGLHAQYFHGKAECSTKRVLHKKIEKVELDSKEKMDSMKDEDGINIFKQYSYVHTR